MKNRQTILKMLDREEVLFSALKEESKSITFIHPSEGPCNVKIINNNKFINTTNDNVTSSISYYGNYLDNVVCPLNACMTNDGDFLIRRRRSKQKAVEFEAIGSSTFLEIIHPEWGIYAVKRRANVDSFSIFRLDNAQITPFGMFTQKRKLAISLSVSPHVQETIKSRLGNCLTKGDFGHTSKSNVINKLPHFHLGLIDLGFDIPEPHFTLLKRKFIQIVYGVQAFEFDFSKFEIRMKRRGTIYIVPKEGQVYKNINSEMNKFLDMFNCWFKTNYSANEFTTREKYCPHITLLNQALVAQVLGVTLEDLNKHQDKVKKLEQYLNKSLSEGLPIKFKEKTKYQIDANVISKYLSKYLINFAQMRLDLDFSQTTNLILSNQNMTKANRFAGSEQKKGKQPLVVNDNEDIVLQLTQWLSIIGLEGCKSQRNFYGTEPYLIHYREGDCLFASIAAFVPNETAMSLRKRVTQHIERDGQLKSSIITLINSETPETLRTKEGDKVIKSFRQYIMLMQTEETWGTAIEIVALARSLQRPIVILTPNNQYDYIVEEETYRNNQPIFLNYVAEIHYAPLSVPENKNAIGILNEIREAIEEAIEERNNERKRNIQQGSSSNTAL